MEVGGRPAPDEPTRAVQRSQTASSAVIVDGTLACASPGEAAGHYLQAGFQAFPLSSGKRPLANCRLCKAGLCGGPGRCCCGSGLCHGFYAATADASLVAGWFEEHPKWNLGVRTGSGSKLVVLDVDFDKGGKSTLEVLRAQGLTTVGCPVVHSGSGQSVHYYFRQPAEVVVPCSVGKFGPGVDVRGDGGYAVAAGSVHPDTGQRYSLMGDLSALPPWSMTREESVQTPGIGFQTATPAIRPPGGWVTKRRVEGWVRVVAAARAGYRRETLFWAACRLAEAGGTAQERRDAAGALAQAALGTGLPASEVGATIVDALSSAP